MTPTTIRALRACRLLALGLGSTLALGSCGDFNAPSQNAATLDDLEKGSPTRAAVNTAVQGLFGGVRASNNGLVLGILGREAYSLDVSNPQNTPQFYTVQNQLQAQWGGPMGASSRPTSS